jgi:DDE superfamily endonuclease
VILDGTLLRIDRVDMASGRDRAYYSGKHKAHGLNVQVIADPVGRLVWISPPLSGARHDMGAAREHGIIDAFTDAEIPAVADTAYQGAGPTVAVPQRRRRRTPAATGACPGTRRRSTQPTPGAADRASGSTPS